jgi:hypothetical protein
VKTATRTETIERLRTSGIAGESEELGFKKTLASRAANKRMNAIGRCKTVG